MEEPAHLRAVPNEQAPRAPLGEVLVERGFLTPGQLDTALSEQSATGRPLGEIVVALGLASPPDVALALAAQHGGALKTEYGFAVSSSAPPLRSDDGAPPVTPQPAAPEPVTDAEPRQIFTEPVPAVPEPAALMEPAQIFAERVPAEVPLAPATLQPDTEQPAEDAEPRQIFTEPVPAVPDGQLPTPPFGTPGDVPEPAAVMEPAQIVAERVPAEVPMAPATLQPETQQPAEDLEPMQIFTERVPAVPDGPPPAAVVELAQISADPAPPLTAVPLALAATLPVASPDPLGDHLELLAVRVATLQAELSGAHGRIAELETKLAAPADRIAERAARFVASEHHTVFVAGREGYELHEVHGPPPLEGATITLPDEMGAPGPHIVTRVAATSPDGRPLPCAYLLLV